MIPGCAFYLGSKLYLIPPLSIAQYNETKADREAVRNAIADDGQMTGELLGSGSRIVLAAARRNYPELTIEDVGNGISPREMFTILGYVLMPSRDDTTVWCIDGQAARAPTLFLSPDEPPVV